MVDLVIKQFVDSLQSIDSTIIEDTLNNTLQVTFSGNIAEDGDRPGITDEIFDFKIPETLQENIFEATFDLPKQPAQSVPDAAALPPPIKLPLVLIAPKVVSDYALGNCLTYESLSSFDTTMYFTIPILSSFESVSDKF